MEHIVNPRTDWGRSTSPFPSLLSLRACAHEHASITRSLCDAADQAAGGEGTLRTPPLHREPLEPSTRSLVTVHACVHPRTPGSSHPLVAACTGTRMRCEAWDQERGEEGTYVSSISRSS
jgi:hypothetical protein